MNRWTVLLVAMVFTTLVTIGCSNGVSNPVVPTDGTDLTASSQGSTQNSNTYLWGYYDVTIDLATQSITAVPDRTTMFAANVVNILNSNPSAMVFLMNDLNIGIDVVEVDIDVELSHPFDAMPQFNGYDVRGVFCGAGSNTLSYDSSYDFPEPEDQFMLDDPLNADGGGPDGYTRWFNAGEFGTPGMFGYTEGAFGSSGFSPTATLMPYKYFADGITVADDPFEFLLANAGDNGVFASGSTNTRNYYLEFPLPTPGATFGYVILANWEDPATHPSNAHEAVACSVTITDNIYYVDGTNNGGNLILDFDLYCWEDQPSAIFIESQDVLSAVYELTPTEMMGTGGGLNYSTYNVEITADDVTFNSATEGDGDFWIIAEADGYDYQNDGMNPTGPSDTLAAFFRYDLFIQDFPYNAAPVVDTGVDGEDTPFMMAVETYAVTAHDDDGDPLTYSWTVTDNGTGNPDPNYDGEPGDGAGNVDVDWGLVGAGDLDEYDVDCEVSDGMDETQATTLTVTCSNVLFLYDGTVDDGGMTTIGYGKGAGNWTFLPDEDLWDENGNTGSENYNMFRTLGTPTLDIPSFSGSLMLEVTHSGDVPDYYGSYSFASGMVGYTTNGGTNVNWDRAPCSGASQWLTFSSGTNFNHNRPYGNLGVYPSNDQGCQAFGSWQGRVFADTWGSLASPVTSTWSCDPLKGQSDVQVCFTYNHCAYNWMTGIRGWQLNMVKIYATP